MLLLTPASLCHYQRQPFPHAAATHCKSFHACSSSLVLYLRPRPRRGPTREEWEQAPSANYESNVDLGYVCSDAPYAASWSDQNNNKGNDDDDDDEIRLVSSNLQSDILDFWGEGRIEWEGVVTGFSNSYNVNHQFKLVSASSKDFNRRIPNRIPTESFEHTDVKAYVACDTFRFVTLMGAPIHARTAAEMTRMVRKHDDDDGMIILYGVDLPAHIDAVEEQTNKIDFYYDRFTSLLSTEIAELQPITIPDHPACTRVYHTARTVTCLLSSVRECNRTEGITNEGIEYSESLAHPGELLVGYHHVDNGSIVYVSGQIVLDNGIVRSNVLAATKKSSTLLWRYTGIGCLSSFMCPTGHALVGRLSLTEEDGGGGGVWYYQCARLLLCRASLGDTIDECETHNISPWTRVDDSGVCRLPSGAFLVGVKHYGASSWYRYAFARLKETT